jgi:hypothetical protein
MASDATVFGGDAVSGRDVGASVRQRLLNKSKEQARPFQELLAYFAMERFLYRLGQSKHAESFVLKGALLLKVWNAPHSRPTMDIDLAGRTSNELQHLAGIVKELCEAPVESDGVEFDGHSIEIGRIKEDAEYEGARVQFVATIAKARIRMQIDIGFGDVITPEPLRIAYPAILEFAAPELRAYPKETVVAEKLEALTVLGLLNSRIKDYFDLALLARTQNFSGEVLRDAIIATFRNRGTVIESEPVGLTEAYFMDGAREVQWRAFAKRSMLADKTIELVALVVEIRAFLLPVLAYIVDGRPSLGKWPAGGPWSGD